MTSFYVNPSQAVYNNACKKEDVVIGLVAVANELSDKRLKQELIKTICSPFAQKINEYAKMIPTNESQESEAHEGNLSLIQVCKNLEKLSLIAKNLTPAADDATYHELVEVVSALWPLLNIFLTRFYVPSSLIVGHAIRSGGHLQVLQGFNALHQTFIRPHGRTLLHDSHRKLQGALD